MRWAGTRASSAQLLESDNARPAVHLAARPGVITADELAAAVDGTVGRYSPYAVHLTGGDPGRLQPVRDGQALVQDEGSQLVALRAGAGGRSTAPTAALARPVRRPGRQDRAAGRARAKHGARVDRRRTRAAPRGHGRKRSPEAGRGSAAGRRPKP